MKRFLIALVAMLGSLGMFTAVPAGAQSTSDVYVVHGIPGVDVDVYVNGGLLLADFEPEDIAGPLQLAAGDYDIDIFAASATPAAAASDRTDAVVIDVDGAAVPGGASLALVAHLDGEGTPVLGAYVNDRAATSASDVGRVTVRHLAVAPAVDILAGGAAVDGLTGLENGNQASVDLTAGAYPTGIAASGTTDVLVPAPLEVRGGVQTIVYAVGELPSSFTLIVQEIGGLTATNSDVRVIHGIPGLEVDVYAGGALLLPGFDPGDVAGPVSLAPGTLQIEIFAADASPAAASADRLDAAALDVPLGVPTGASVDVIAHLDADGVPMVSAFVNDTSAITPSTAGRVTIRHAAEAPVVDIVAGGAAVAGLTGLANGAGASVVLPAGDYPTGIAATGSTDALVDAPVTVVPGGELRVYAIGTLGSTFDLIVVAESGLSLDPAFRGVSGIDGSIARIYLAVLGRSPDAVGFTYWQGRAADGVTLLDIIPSFEASAEFQARFPDVDTDAEFLDLAYAHVLGRDGDAAGEAYWLDLLARGEIDRHQMLFYFAESAELKAYTGTD